MASDSSETGIEATETGVGANVGRREDRRLVTGDGAFVDDISTPETCYAAVVRSRYAHADVVGIDATEARALDGVIAVLTHDDLIDDSISNRIPPTFPTPGKDSEPMPEYLYRRILPRSKVRYQGEALAVVLAEDRYVAHDAVDAVTVEYDQLDVNVDPVAVVDGDTPEIHEDAPDNVAFELSTGDDEQTAQAFADAPRTVSMRIDNQRIMANYIEPRGVIADFDPTADKLTVRSSTQVPHDLRMFLSGMLDHPENKIRVIAPEVGGGFGGKTFVYPEEPLLALCAMHVERPVKWQATRSESYLADSCGRGLGTTGELAFDDDGQLLGIRASCEYDLGAYVSGHATWLATWGSNLLTGQYDVPAAYYEVTGVLTNTKPVDAYRGVTETEVIQLLERLVDRAAAELDMDPAAIRRQNMLDDDQFPYTNPTGATYDSGQYKTVFDQALERVDYDARRERQAELREDGRYLGVGVACFVEGTGAGPCEPWIQHNTWEYGNVQFHSSGQVSVYVGTSNHGQAHETTYSQIVSEALGIPFDDVEIVEDDTDKVRDGVGTYASRSITVAGAAIKLSSEKLVEKGRQVAARRLEVDADDVEFEDGTYTVAGAPQLSMTIAEVAKAVHLGGDLPDGMEPGLEATTYYDPENMAWTYGVHVPVVEVDPAKGEVEILEYVAVEDCGRLVNPMVVEGQVHGATAQGLGQALYEETVYDERGNLLSGSHMDYSIPKATQIPHMDVEHVETPSPHNPLGVKGTGESGTIVEPAAIVNAIEDALRPFDIDPMTPPVTPETIWNAIQSGQEGGE